MKRILVAAAIVASLGTSPFAFANDSVPIEYRDLDLTTAEGKRTLDMRVERAARTICGMGATQTGTRIQSRQTRACYRNALLKARKNVAALVQNEQLGG